MRARLQTAAILAASLLLAVALVWRFYQRRPPYFARPRTIVDHVGHVQQAQRPTLILLEKVRPLIPPGAQVTCFHPENGKVSDDFLHYLTAVGMLPDNFVLPPFAAGESVGKHDAVEYVVAVGAQFDNPAYKPIAGFREGFLYRVDR